MTAAAKLDYQALPISVDLDGTLVKTDCLIEAVLAVIKKRFYYLFFLPFWLTRGKAHFKQRIFQLVNLDVRLLPYNEELIGYLKRERLKGRRIVLATASPRILADAVASHLGFFDEVFASDAERNLSGSAKAEALVAAFGEKQFIYAGNSFADINVWKKAASALIVYASPLVQRRIAWDLKVEKVFGRDRGFLFLALKATRLHQWAKNILIFSPLALSNQLDEVWLLLESVKGFVAFTFVASCVYLLNDLLDLDSDRLHPDNKKRPFASGELPLVFGLFMAPVFLATGLAIAAAVSQMFFAVVLGYFVTTCLYSFRLKQVALADIIILATLYSWRVFAGSIAAHVELSNWFLIFSGFLFLSLATLKRFSELILLEQAQKRPNPRRAYQLQDLPQLAAFGTSAGYLSVLVFALYLNTPRIASLYERPQFLWLICPFLLYWVSRMWFKGHRGKMHSDPLVFTMFDRASYVVMAAAGILWVLAMGWV